MQPRLATNWLTNLTSWSTTNSPWQLLPITSPVEAWRRWLRLLPDRLKNDLPTLSTVNKNANTTINIQFNMLIIKCVLTVYQFTSIWKIIKTNYATYLEIFLSCYTTYRHTIIVNNINLKRNFILLHFYKN